MPARPSQAEIVRQQASDGIVYSVDAIPEKCRKKYENVPSVGVALKVISISHLDMADNTFMADYNLNIAWAGEKDQKPEIQIYNLMEGQDPEEGEVKKGDKELGFDHFYRVRFKGKYRQQYKLQSFPFDQQELTIRVRIKTECLLVDLPWGPDGSAASCDPGAVDDEFLLIKAEVRPTYLPSYKFGKLAGYDPEAQVVFTMRRIPDFWVHNYGMLMSVVCTFSFLAFALPTGDIGDRLQVGFTLNLTVVATFYLMQDKLPSVSYWTELERHMITCIVFTMTVMLFNCLPVILNEKLVERIDQVIISVLVLIWVAYHWYLKQHIDELIEHSGDVCRVCGPWDHFKRHIRQLEPGAALVKKQFEGVKFASGAAHCCAHKDTSAKKDS